MFDEQIEGLKENGIGYMEIRGVDNKSIADLTEDEMKAAKAEGVYLCHENERGIYGADAEHCLDIQKEFNGEIKLIFDPANLIIDGFESYPHSYNLLGDSIYYMHIKDAVAEKRICPAGKGVGGLQEIISDLNKKHDGAVILTVEPHLKVFCRLRCSRGRLRCDQGSYRKGIITVTIKTGVPSRKFAAVLWVT